MDLYRDIILDHFRHPHNRGRLKNPTATVAVSNELCGDDIILDIVVNNTIVDSIGFEGEGCAISQASMSLLSEEALGKSVKELKRLRMDDIVSLLGVSELTPVRLKCALLSLEALHKALDKT